MKLFIAITTIGYFVQAGMDILRSTEKLYTATYSKDAYNFSIIVCLGLGIWGLCLIIKG